MCGDASSIVHHCQSFVTRIDDVFKIITDSPPLVVHYLLTGKSRGGQAGLPWLRISYMNIVFGGSEMEVGILNMTVVVGGMLVLVWCGVWMVRGGESESASREICHHYRVSTNSYAEYT